MFSMKTRLGHTHCEVKTKLVKTGQVSNLWLSPMKKDSISCGRNLYHHEFNGIIEIFVIVTTMVIFHTVNVLKENPCFAVWDWCQKIHN